MKIIDEFKEFAIKGNVVDMAVGIIIGGAFGKIVSSFVADVIMPPLGLLIGGVNFTDLSIVLKREIIDAAGAVTAPAVTLNYGNFIQVVFDFLIIAFAIFSMIKFLNNLKKKPEPVVEQPSTPPPPSAEVQLLSEIRDLLKKEEKK